MTTASTGSPRKGNLLVVTADDFGLDEAVNAAVETAHRAGVLSAASLMVNGAAADDAIRRAHALPTLRVGLHLVLVDGTPVLPRDEIPDLVDREGRLRSDLARLGVQIACHRNLRKQLTAEIAAQFCAFERSGLRLDHVNAHKHFHLHPCVAREVIAIGRAFGMKAMRVPAEPWRCLAAGSCRGRLSSDLLRPWISRLRSKARDAGLLTADAVFGMAWSGAFTSERLIGLLGRLPPGLIEIYLHPATQDDFPGHASGYRYRAEFEALCSPATRDAAARCGYRLASYEDAGSRPRSLIAASA